MSHDVSRSIERSGSASFGSMILVAPMQRKNVSQRLCGVSESPEAVIRRRNVSFGLGIFKPSVLFDNSTLLL